MITNFISKELRYKSFNRFSKFVLIGNNVDGYVNVDFIEFQNFEEVKKLLPPVIKSLKFEGEWKLSFYQISGNLKIKRLYGYYRVPARGKLILEMTYMNVCRNIDLFITDSIIHVSSTTGILIKEYNNAGLQGEIFEEYITVVLCEEKIKKNQKNESYSLVNQDHINLKGFNDLGIK